MIFNEFINEKFNDSQKYEVPGYLIKSPSYVPLTKTWGTLLRPPTSEIYDKSYVLGTKVHHNFLMTWPMIKGEAQYPEPPP
jgi:hypothetical protein